MKEKPYLIMGSAGSGVSAALLSELSRISPDAKVIIIDSMPQEQLKKPTEQSITMLIRNELPRTDMISLKKINDPGFFSGMSRRERRKAINKSRR
jgi:type IV secretory pathway ATPase VirB11/archaellum biosynthesis ATPase